MLRGWKIRLSAVLALTMLPLLPAYADPPVVEGCQIFPEDNPWNMDVSEAPVDPNSDAYIANINANGDEYLHPDFGEDPTYGIPYTTVTNDQPEVPISFYYPDESDPGPYPIPPDAPIEGGVDADGDRHILVINTDSCTLYEIYDAWPVDDPPTEWEAGSGAVFDLNTNDLRPDGWTSADAAGLPIFPGLARCDEVMSGEVNHAFRFTVEETQQAYIYPATHYASDITDEDYPPMGLRLRLKADFDLSGFTGQSLVIATALKRYGMMLADNGSNWFISGEADRDCWDAENLEQLKDIPGSAFEVVTIEPPAQ